MESHAPEEIGIDSFQADRSPDRRYRTSPLKGLWTHTKGGFYHDGRFATLRDLIEHYDTFFGLRLTTQEKRDLISISSRSRAVQPVRAPSSSVRRTDGGNRRNVREDGSASPAWLFVAWRLSVRAVRRPERCASNVPGV